MAFWIVRSGAWRFSGGRYEGSYHIVDPGPGSELDGNTTDDVDDTDEPPPTEPPVTPPPSPTLQYVTPADGIVVLFDKAVKVGTLSPGIHLRRTLRPIGVAMFCLEPGWAGPTQVQVHCSDGLGDLFDPGNLPTLAAGDQIYPFNDVIVNRVLPITADSWLWGEVITAPSSGDSLISGAPSGARKAPYVLSVAIGWDVPLETRVVTP